MSWARNDCNVYLLRIRDGRVPICSIAEADPDLLHPGYPIELVALASFDVDYRGKRPAMWLLSRSSDSDGRI